MWVLQENKVPIRGSAFPSVDLQESAQRLSAGLLSSPAPSALSERQLCLSGPFLWVTFEMDEMVVHKIHFLPFLVLLASGCLPTAA